MKGERVNASSIGARNLDDLMKSGVRAKSDVNAIAVRGSHNVNILVWNYQDDAEASSPMDMHLRVEGLLKGASRMLLEHGA